MSATSLLCKRLQLVTLCAPIVKRITQMVPPAAKNAVEGDNSLSFQLPEEVFLFSSNMGHDLVVNAGLS